MRVAANRRGDDLVLVVDDDGPGFDHEAVADGRPAARGFGLGRSIVAHHVDELRGELELRSAPERGTTVTVRLPLGA